MRIKRLMQRTIALALALVLMSVDAQAAVLHVYIYGVRSINDRGNSDYRISMEDLEDDYDGYLQTNVLTEFFHKDVGEIPKTDMDEALSWLIDHNIVSRDQTITVSNANSVPSTNIDKIDISNVRYTSVNRSDAVMYIYKSVFGPLEGRTIGVETPNIRSDGSTERTLHSIMVDNGYYETINQPTATIIQQGNTGGSYQIESSCVTTEDGHYDHQVITGEGGSPGSQQLGVIRYNSDAKWRYTPQGDKFINVLGDTNIFVSDIDILQQANTGNAQMGGAVGSPSGGSSVTTGDNTHRDNSWGNGVNGSSNHNPSYTETGATGGINAGVAVDMDYKAVYYTPKVDVLFYNTTDVVEMYLQSLESKGILPNRLAPSTEKFKSTILPLTKSGASLASWSGYADSYIVNMTANQRVRIEKVNYASLREMLGANYTVRFANQALTISRNNLFASNTGYFENEMLTKMETLEYIYWMLFANEKKLTTLEVDIVNYKYGLELSGLASSNDIEVIKYLIAKGILNYDGSNDLANLYSYITWDEMFQLLYRVANPNARLDFSIIQLTDSETAWKAKGFQPMTVNLLEGESVRSSSEITGAAIDGVGIEDEETPLIATPFVQASAMSLKGGPFIEADAAPPATGAEAGTESYVAEVSMGLKSVKYGHWYFGMDAAWGEPKQAMTYLDEQFSAIDGTSWGLLQQPFIEGYNSGNPIHKIHAAVADNIWVCYFAATNDDYCEELLAKFDTKIEEVKTVRDSYNTGTQDWTIKDAVYSQLKGAKNAFEKGIEEIVKVSDNDKVNNTLAQYFITTTDPNGNTVADNSKIVKPGLGGAFAGVEKVTFQRLEGLTIVFEEGNRTAMQGGTNPNSLRVKVRQTYTMEEVAKIGGQDAVNQQFKAKLAITRVNGASRKGLETYTNGSDQYVSYESLLASGNITQWKGNEWILFNSANGVRAIFTNSGQYNSGDANLTMMPTALIGSIVVRSSNNSLGVAYRDSTTGQIMYHMDAVRALLGATSEVETLGTEHLICVPDSDFSSMVKSYDVMSTSGVKNGSVSAVALCLASGPSSSNQPLTKAGMDTSSPYWNGSQYTSDGVTSIWKNFLSVNETSNLVNYVVRRVTYNVPDSDKKAVGYMVLSFEVDESLTDASKKVNSGTMLQDMLDTPNLRPDDATAASIWDRNKNDANMFANVIYKTSGQNYVQTGWLKPKLDFYVCGDKTQLQVPESVFSPLSDVREEYDDKINTHSMVAYDDGSVMRVDKVGQNLTATGALTKTHATYWMSEDAKIAIVSDRVYLNQGAVPGLTTGRNSKNEFVFIQTNAMANPSSFTVGTIFKVLSDKNNPPIEGVIMETTDTGRVKAQMGPVYGYPIIISGRAIMVQAGKASSTSKFTMSPGSGTYIGLGDGTVDNIYGSYLRAFSSSIFSEVEYKGVSTNPFARRKSTENNVVFSVFDGTKVTGYTREGRPTATYRPVETATFENSPSEIKTRFEEWWTNKADQKNMRNPAFTMAYFDVEFDATRYKIVNGQLTGGSASATDYMSPELFTSLNNIIIDGMLGKATGAIPINEVPEGALLQIGNGWYVSKGSSVESKEFVGFAELSGNSYVASLQNTALAYASHNIRAGNQLVNVSHFFLNFKILDLVSGTDKNEYDSALNVVKQETMSSSVTDTKLLAVNTSGRSTILANSTKSTTSLYAAVSIKFQNYLMAFEELESESGVQRYTILPTAVSDTSSESPNVDGAFEDVPFFQNSVLERGISEATSDIVASGYQRNPLADSLRETLQRDFQRLLAGDLITLVRFLVFLVLMWLVLAAWLCYVARIGNLMPILDAIKHPSGDRNQNGPDLMKLVSLGTISLETEFGLGKFLQYNAILCVLLCVVMLTGNITLGGA